MAKKPLFKEIKEFIINQIQSKTYLAGHKIPTEAELVESFKTSRPTVNKAISELVIEGYVERFARSGTFVKKQVPQSSILDLKSIASEVIERNNIYSNELVLLEEIKASEEIAQILNVVKDQKIFISKMIHKENDVPVRFDIRYIKPSCVKDYLKQDFKTITPNEYLQKVCPVQKVQNSIEAIMPTEIIQTLLDISKDEPCLLISRIVISQKQIASYSKLYYPSSRYKLNSTWENSSNSFI
jgi:GntR family histidine utilization transcriptional repressor